MYKPRTTRGTTLITAIEPFLEGQGILMWWSCFFLSVFDYSVRTIRE